MILHPRSRILSPAVLAPLWAQHRSPAMRTIPTSLPPVTAAAIFAAVSAAHGQSCLWTSHGSQPQGFGQMIYHSGLQRVLFVATEQYPLTAVQIWSWDGAAWTLLSSNGPSARSAASRAYDSARDRLVLFGGAAVSTGSPNLSETWRWDRLAWTQSPVNGPSA